MMPAIDDTAIAIARVYADALLQSAEAGGRIDDLLAEMRDLLAGLEKDEAFTHFLYSPAIDDDARRAVLERLRGKMSDLLLNALHVMNDKSRLTLLPHVVEGYRLAAEAKRGEVDVQITTAVPLPKRLRSRLESVASSIAGRQPRLVEAVDDTMIGGIVLQVEDEKYDATVSRKLRQLRDTLIDRASREIHSGKQYFDPVQA